MTDAERPDLEERIRAEVDRAVAGYEGKVPPFMLAKLRELAERYWRENEVAAQALRVTGARVRSGTEAVGEPHGEDAADAAKKA